MSYVRWSNYSDIYAYADAGGGITIHVGSRRRRRGGPTLTGAFGNRAPGNSWVKKKILWYKYRLYMWTLKIYDWVFPLQPIGLEHDGETINVSTFKDYLETVIELRDMGYYVPDHVVNYARDAQHLPCGGGGCDDCDLGEKRE